MIHTTISSPIGPILLVGDGQILRGLYTSEHVRPPAVRGEEDGSAFPDVQNQLSQYFAGDRMTFDVKMDLPGTPFQRKVWHALSDIGYGELATYGEIARRIGSPQAMRAVGMANGRNQISIIVPCHRVIGSDGKLTGYAGGLAAKQWLLRHEAAHR